MGQIFSTSVIVITSFFALSCAQIPSSSTEKTESEKTYQGIGLSSVSPEDLERFSPKPIDKELTSRIESLMDIRAPYGVRVSNDGKTSLFQWTVSGVPHIWRLREDEPFPVQLTGGVESARLIDFSADEKTFYFARDRGGDEFYGLYEMDVTGGAPREIYRKENVNISLQHITDDGKFLYFIANDIDPSWYSLYRLERKTGATTLLVGEAGYWRLADRQENGLLLVSRVKTNIHSEFYLLDENNLTEGLKPLLGVDESEDYQMSFSHLPDHYFLRTNKFGEYRRLFLYGAKDLSFVPVTKAREGDIASFDFDKKSGRLLVNSNRGGYYETEAYETPSLREIAVAKFELADSTVYRGGSRNGQFGVFQTESFDGPGVFFRYHWQTKRLKQLSFSSLPEVGRDNFVRDTLEYYPSRDGVMIPMFVKRPPACEKKLCPVIVNFHGGPESQSTPGFSSIEQIYLDHGYIYVRPNIRGSSGYGKTWLDADNGPRRLDVLSDIADAGLFIKKSWARDGVEPKVGVMGGSYGGYATFIAMTKYAGVYDAGVASVGMSSLVTFLENTAPYRRALRESEYGFLDKDREALIALSPITYIDRLNRPLLIIQGATDPRVPAGEAVQMYNLMASKKIDGDLILFSDEGHGVRKRENRVLSSGHTLLFFERFLKESQSQ